ncbi:hypothetical protein [Aquisphaera insulae]|uniref:hypothetical protein n=1 Tax=Aquisphaera insulae TaxID=2712864 RepID=UPI0013EB30C6|nr:hypothetical protein [Aquisphaera insulae]
MIIAYAGPETMLPIASVLAGAVGVVMMFGRNVLAIGRRAIAKCLPRSGGNAGKPKA